MTTPWTKYRWHKNRARTIGFELTFEEWWDIWQKSGHWEDRGRGKGSYVMSRVNDQGPYKVGNVFINTQENNARDAWLGKTRSADDKQKKSNAQKGIKKSAAAVANNAASQMNRPKYGCLHCKKMISGYGNLTQHINSKHKETLCA